LIDRSFHTELAIGGSSFLGFSLGEFSEATPIIPEPFAPSGSRSMRDADLDRLEFSRFRDVLLRFATSFRGGELLGTLTPFEHRHEAEHVLLQVETLRARHEQGVGVPPLEIGDLRVILARLKTPGSVLTGPDLLELLPLLQGTRVAKKSLEGDDLPAEITELGVPLSPFPQLEHALASALDAEGDVKDSASPELRRLRRAKESARERIRERLERQASRLPSGDSPALVTLREGRYVLSVPTEHRTRVPGLLLDRSGSGATLYIEPLEAVEANNTLRELEVEEAAEVRRILAELCDRARTVLPQLTENWEHTGRLDALRARVLLAARWHAERPRFTDDLLLDLKGARHPLLLETRGAGSNWEAAVSRVIPLDLRLDDATRLLLITGPNMGGKTVALKTVGLLSVMAQCGCLIPAAPDSVLPWTGDWVVSLGDEQSLENDLSTFAAHLVRWAEALELAGPRTLVLLDELGSGTDPIEGAALAQSVLERLLASGAMGLVTTHLGVLKSFAAESDGIENASMVFDTSTSRPSYTLAVGIPGESHALDMARRLGFPETEVARAEALLPQAERDVRRLLAELREETARVAKEKAELMDEVREARERSREARDTLERILKERAEIRARAARQARELIRRSEELLKRAEKDAADGKRSADLSRQALLRQQEHLLRLERQTEPKDRGEAPEDIKKGERLWAASLGREVEVLREPDPAGRVVVESQGLRVTLPKDSLRPARSDAPENAPARIESSVRMPEPTEAAMEVDLRGMRVDESLSRLEHALDQAMLAGLKRLRVIHGKGTGALRRAVLEYCKKHGAIGETQIAEQWEGGTGATVITLKDE
jgi:DNA mismatch repair protein MutS2